MDEIIQATQTVKMVERVAFMMQRTTKETMFASHAMERYQQGIAALPKTNIAAPTAAIAGYSALTEQIQESIEMMEQVKSVEVSFQTQVAKTASMDDAAAEGEQKAAGGSKGILASLQAHLPIKQVLGQVQSGLQAVVAETMNQSKTKTAISAMIGDPGKADAMFAHIQEKAADSAYSFKDMTKSYQSFLEVTKDVGELDKLQTLTEKAAAFDVTGGGYEGATQAVAAMATGDATGLATQFGVKPEQLQSSGVNELLAQGDLDAGLAKFDELISRIGFTQEAANQMAEQPGMKWEKFTSDLLSSFASAAQPMVSVVTAIIDQLSILAQSQAMQTFIALVGDALYFVATQALGLLELVVAVSGWVGQNWSAIEPVITVIGIAIGSVVGAMKLYQAWTMLVTGATTAYKFALGVAAAAGWVKVGADTAGAGATWASVAAQMGLNTALWACPIVWIIAAIIALIAIMFIWTDVAGFVSGIMGLLFAYIYNRVAFLWNIVASFAEFFANVLRDPVYAVQKLFADLWNNWIDMIANALYGIESFAGDFMKFINKAINFALSGVNKLIEGFNWLFGTDFGQVELLDVENIHAASDAIKALKMDVPTTDADVWNAPRMEQMNYEESFNTGFDTGKGMAEGIKNQVGGIMDGLQPPADPTAELASIAQPELASISQPELASGMGLGTGSEPIPVALPEDMPGSQMSPAVVDEVDISEESVKLMRDVADMRFTQNFVTVTPKVALGGVTVNENADYDRLVGKIASGLEEGLQTTASGVYA